MNVLIKSILEKIYPELFKSKEEIQKELDLAREDIKEWRARCFSAEDTCRKMRDNVKDAMKESLIAHDEKFNTNMSWWS